MLKLLREGNQNYPWLIKGTMVAIAVTFIVGMGWWGYGQEDADTIATIGPLTISRDEFLRRYKSVYENAKDKMPEALKDDILKQMVLEQMVEEKLWMLAAKDMNLSVTPAELRDSIVHIKDFHQNGKFDPEVYTRIMAYNHLTPAQFEVLHAERLLAEKALTVILDSVALTPAEVEEAKTLMARQTSAESITGPSASDRILQDMLMQKQQRAMMAYKEAMKSKAEVQVHKELL